MPAMFLFNEQQFVLLKLISLVQFYKTRASVAIAKNALKCKIISYSTIQSRRVIILI